MYPSHDDWVYTAGLVDGEGSIGVYLSHRRWRKTNRSPIFTARVSVINTDEPVLRWLQERFSGRITPRRRLPLRQQVYTWELDGQAAADFLRRLHPYLRIKAAQAWLLQEAWAQRTLQQGRRRLSDEEMALRQGYAFASAYLNHGGAA